jgi:hypothetical protein
MKTILILILSASACLARIGETLEQCSARYGKEISRQKEGGKEVIGFLKGELMTGVQMREAKAVTLLFVKHNENQAFPPELSAAELKTLLDANSAGSTWVETTKQFDFVNRTWKTQNDERMAIYDTVKRTLIITTFEEANRMASEKEAAEKKDLDGY